MLKEDSHVDVAFMVDCTQSMSKYIEKTKHNIDSIVGRECYPFLLGLSLNTVYLTFRLKSALRIWHVNKYVKHFCGACASWWITI